MLICFRFVVIFVSGERDFRVDHYITFVGEVKNDIGYEASAGFVVGNDLAVLVFHRPLLIKLHTALESHIFQEGAQAKFSEVALRFVLSCERSGEFVGTFAHQTSLGKGNFNAFVES